MDNTISILDKVPTELTVRDNLKLTLASTAVMVGGLVVIAGVVTAADKIVAWKKNRKANATTEPEAV